MTERKRPDVIECPSSVESTRFGTDGGTRPARCPMSVSEGGCPNPLVGDVVQILLTFFPRRPYGIDSRAARRPRRHRADPPGIHGDLREWPKHSAAAAPGYRDIVTVCGRRPVPIGVRT